MDQCPQCGNYMVANWCKRCEDERTQRAQDLKRLANAASSLASSSVPSRPEHQQGVCGACGQLFVESTRVYQGHNTTWTGPFASYASSGVCPKCFNQQILIGKYCRPATADEATRRDRTVAENDIKAAGEPERLFRIATRIEATFADLAEAARDKAWKIELETANTIPSILELHKRACVIRPAMVTNVVRKLQDYITKVLNDHGHLKMTQIFELRNEIIDIIPGLRDSIDMAIATRELEESRDVDCVRKLSEKYGSRFQAIDDRCKQKIIEIKQRDLDNEFSNRFDEARQRFNVDELKTILEREKNISTNGRKWNEDRIVELETLMLDVYNICRKKKITRQFSDGDYYESEEYWSDWLQRVRNKYEYERDVLRRKYFKRVVVAECDESAKDYGRKAARGRNSMWVGVGALAGVYWFCLSNEMSIWHWGGVGVVGACSTVLAVWGFQRWKENSMWRKYRSDEAKEAANWSE